MKKAALPALFAFSSIFCLASFIDAQESKTPAAKPAAKTAAEVEKPKGRLPNNFGKVDLTSAQREKIYAIQSDYDTQLDALKDQIKALVAKRDADVEAVLTAEQKSKLEELRAETKRRTAELVEARKKEAEAKKAAEAAKKSGESKE